MPKFELDAAYTPTADQPPAIAWLAEGVLAGEHGLTLLGATGTGKTMTMAGVIEAVEKPALVIAHNKTMAAQLCNEFRTYFLNNAVEYFVSYYDYAARGLSSQQGSVHREGLGHQPGDRPAAPFGYRGPVRPA